MSIANTIRTSDAPPLATVIVPHFDQVGLLTKCLESLERQTLPRDAFEIIVVDNMTPGGVASVTRAFPQIRFAEAKERGAACARNVGLSLARSDAIAFIDADCTAAPDWLETGVAALARTDLVGGRIDVTMEDAAAPTPVEAFERVFAFRQRDYVERKRFSVTANLFVASATARAIGPFRNGVAEDVDWCRRADALGFRLAFNDSSRVSHPARRTWSELIRKWDRITVERWRGFGGRGSARRLSWAALAVATALSAGPHVVAVFMSARLEGVRQRAAAAGVLARIRFWRARRMLALLADA